MSEPWGHKITFVVYVKAPERTLDSIIGTLANAAESWPCVEFAGASTEPVQNEPRDQVAT